MNETAYDVAAVLQETLHEQPVHVTDVHVCSDQIDVRFVPGKSKMAESIITAVMTFADDWKYDENSGDVPVEHIEGVGSVYELTFHRIRD